MSSTVKVYYGLPLSGEDVARAAERAAQAAVEAVQPAIDAVVQASLDVALSAALTPLSVRVEALEAGGGGGGALVIDVATGAPGTEVTLVDGLLTVPRGADALVATYATDLEANAFSIANPAAAVFSSEGITAVPAISFATDAEAQAYAAANPGVAVFSREVS